jgi:hypothetical protein
MEGPGWRGGGRESLAGRPCSCPFSEKSLISLKLRRLVRMR